MQNFNGLEIDMLSVGNADSILVTHWTDNIPCRVLIDGGNKSNTDDVKEFLHSQNITYIDHVVCTHPHDDHAGGLVDLVSDINFHFGQAWVHQPYKHVSPLKMRETLAKASNQELKEQISKSIETVKELLAALVDRGIPHSVEPFKDEIIGFLTVCGPSKKFYEDQIGIFSDSEKLNKFVDQRIYQLFYPKSEQDSTAEKEGGLLENPETSPLNETSVILATVFDGNIFLFTADAGANALWNACSSYNLSDCFWMQAPHHGSRRNITKKLIEHFSPSVVFASAKGNRKHPRIAVVNAFKDNGAKVYSTHYPTPAFIRHKVGTVPQRDGLVSATPLYDAKAFAGVG